MLTWNKTPGGVAKVAAGSGDTGVMAVSSDDRFVVWVSRRMVGGKGQRSYDYRFRVVDRQSPGQAKDIQLPYGTDSNLTKVLKAAEKWAADHPAPAQESLRGLLKTMQTLVGG